MKEEILAHLNEPQYLEKLYRNNKTLFKHSFAGIFPTLKGNLIADCWNERLNYDNDHVKWGSKLEVIFIVVASLVAGLIAKLPTILSLNEEVFYSRNISFIVLPALMAFFAWKNNLDVKKYILIIGSVLAGLLFINLFPKDTKSDTLILSCIHLPLFLWSMVGFTYVGHIENHLEKRLAFLKYNGDLLVMTALIIIAGGIMTGTTIGLFSLIGFKIEKFYFDYIGIFGISAAPIVGTYLTQTNPQLVGKISPLIAKIFSPVVLVMLVIYLGAIFYSGRNPYNDREFLRIFNILLIGVLAIIFFSVAEISQVKSKIEVIILCMLSTITVIINGIALSSILYRIYEGGLTPNRAAVLGGDGLILISLILITIRLYKVLAKKAEIDSVRNIIATYLPIYFVWTIIVTFIFPLIYWFK